MNMREDDNILIEIASGKCINMHRKYDMYGGIVVANMHVSDAIFEKKHQLSRRRNVHLIFELSLQFSRSKGPPVFAPSRICI